MIRSKKHITIIIGVLLSLFLVNSAIGEFDLLIEIPTRTITVDGLPDDWAGIEPFFVDTHGDSTCGVGTDIKSVFIAQDNDYLYWRTDTYSNTFLFTEQWMGPVFSIAQHRDSGTPGDIEAAVNDNAMGMNGWIYTSDPPNSPITSYWGPEYGWADVVAEGKIPLSVFSGATFIFLLGRYSETGPTNCDDWVFDPRGGDGGGCFIEAGSRGVL